MLDETNTIGEQHIHHHSFPDLRIRENLIPLNKRTTVDPPRSRPSFLSIAMGSDDPWLTTGIDPWSAGRVSKNGVAAATTTTSTGPAPRASTPPPSDSEESPSAAKAGPPSSWINGSANGIGHAPKPKHPPASLKPQAFQAPPPSGPAVPSGPAGPAPHGPPVAKVAPAVTSTNARSEGEGKASTCLLQVPHSGFADAKDPDLKKVGALGRFAL